MKVERDAATAAIDKAVDQLSEGFGDPFDGMSAGQMGRVAKLQTVAGLVAAELGRLRISLDRYEFNEKAEKVEEKGMFAAEIAKASPAYSDGADHQLYQLALALVNQRHEKYPLVDLVNWLLAENDAKTKALSEVVRFSEQPQLHVDAQRETTRKVILGLARNALHASALTGKPLVGSPQA